MGVMESGALFVGENPHFFIPVMLLGWAKRAPIKFSEEKKEKYSKKKKEKMPIWTDIQGLPWPEYQEPQCCVGVGVTELTWARSILF